MAPPKLLVVNFPINLRCYVLLGCRVIHVILAINIGDSAFFDIAAPVCQFGGLRHHQQTESIHWPPPNQNPGYATAPHHWQASLSCAILGSQHNWDLGWQVKSKSPTRLAFMQLPRLNLLTIAVVPCHCRRRSSPRAHKSTPRFPDAILLMDYFKSGPTNFRSINLGYGQSTVV